MPRVQESLTVFATPPGGAAGVRAQDAAGVFDGDEAVGARVVRAERLTTLLRLASAALALHLVGLGDRGVAVRAANGVAELLRLLRRSVAAVAVVVALCARQRGNAPDQWFGVRRGH